MSEYAGKYAHLDAVAEERNATLGGTPTPDGTQFYHVDRRTNTDHVADNTSTPVESIEAEVPEQEGESNG